MGRYDRLFALVAASFTLWTLFLVIYFWKQATFSIKPEELGKVINRAAAVESVIRADRHTLGRLSNRISKLKSLNRVTSSFMKNGAGSREWSEPIPVLVFACNRAVAVREHVQKLLRIRGSDGAGMFPIIVSQDCDDKAVHDVVQSFGDKIQYIKHVAGEKANITVPNNHRMYTAYYRIARHYNLALQYVFDEKKYTSVIITEDDLSVADDFLAYFSGTRYLLEEDPSLWCVSAWNDNGKIGVIDLDAPEKLYRSDFFPGLGWMMTGSLWREIGQIWPAGFWDDWMRDPLRRLGRQCIRPEISRTGMSTYGKEGASKGQFFSKHLARVHVNQQFVDFRKFDLDYLLLKNYNSSFNEEVNTSPLLNIADALQQTISTSKNKLQKLRVQYSGNRNYIITADAFHIMHDFKAGVPRTAYNGIVTCFINGVRVYLVPDPTTWTGYNPNWYVLPEFGE